MKNLFFSGFYLLLFFLPIVNFPNSFNSFELPKTIFFIVTVDFLTVLYLIGVFSRKWPIRKLNFLSLLILLFTLIVFLTSLFGVDPYTSFMGSRFRFQGFLTFGHYVLFFLLFQQAFSLGLSQKRIAVSLLGGALVGSLVAVYQGLALFIFKLPILTYNGRIFATFGNPNFLGGYLAIASPFILTLQTKRPLRFSVATLFLAAIFLSQSRGAILSLLVVVSLYFIFASQKPLIKKFLVLMALFLFLSSLLLKLNSKREASPYDQRKLIWQVGIESFLKRPVLGYGLENFELAIKENIQKDWRLSGLKIDKAHNEFLEVLVATGLIGFLVYLNIITKALIKGLKLAMKKKNHWKAIFLALIGFLVRTQFNVVSTGEYVFFWFLLANLSQ